MKAPKPMQMGGHHYRSPAQCPPHTVIGDHHLRVNVSPSVRPDLPGPGHLLSAYLEGAITLSSPQLYPQKLEVVEGGVPGQEVVFPLQITDEGEGCAVRQLSGPRQVQRVINQLKRSRSGQVRPGLLARTGSGPARHNQCETASWTRVSRVMSCEVI